MIIPGHCPININGISWLVLYFRAIHTFAPISVTSCKKRILALGHGTTTWGHLKHIFIHLFYSILSVHHYNIFFCIKHTFVLFRTSRIKLKIFVKHEIVYFRQKVYNLLFYLCKRWFIHSRLIAQDDWHYNKTKLTRVMWIIFEFHRNKPISVTSCTIISKWGESRLESSFGKFHNLTVEICGLND